MQKRHRNEIPGREATVFFPEFAAALFDLCCRHVSRSELITPDGHVGLSYNPGRARPRGRQGRFVHRA